MRTIKELKELTDKWAQDRKIDINGKYTTQWLKLISEVGELADSIAKDKSPIDDIGDCLVVLSNMELIIRTQKLYYASINIDALIHDVEHHVNTYDKFEHSSDIHTHIKYLLNNIAAIKDINDYLYDTRNIVYRLTHLAKHYNLTLQECWTYAYEEIKDRKGYLNELGNFIKEV